MNRFLKAPIPTAGKRQPGEPFRAVDNAKFGKANCFSRRASLLSGWVTLPNGSHFREGSNKNLQEAWFFHESLALYTPTYSPEGRRWKCLISQVRT